MPSGLFEASVARGEGTASHQWDDPGLGAVRVSCRADARAVLATAAPLIIVAEYDNLIGDDAAYTAGGAFRPSVLAHRRAELLATPATPAAVTTEPAGPRVWRVTGMPNAEWPDDTLGTLYRDHEGRWETYAESCRWIASGWRDIQHMRGNGFELTEVPAGAEPGEVSG